MTKDTMPYVYFQGSVRPSQEARVSIASNTLQYGTGCFAGIKGSSSVGKVGVFRLMDHHTRLMQGAKILGIDYFMAYENFKEMLAELIAKNAPEGDFYIRPFIFSSQEELAPRPKGLKFELAVYLVQLSNYFDPEKGLKLMVSSWRKFPDASMPTKAKASGCYINSFLAAGEAMRFGCDDALMMDQEGSIVEASAANILLVRRGKILSPEVGLAALEGITLRSVCELLQEEDFSVDYGKIDRSMVYTADEMLLLGTAAQVSYVSSVDGRTFGDKPGAICLLLRKRFKEIFLGSHAKAKDWMVYF